MPFQQITRLNVMITVLTPIYNRRNFLKTLYKSLLLQTSYDFEWLIIDDGSNDNPEEVVQEFMTNSPFSISFKRKENGGKHTALNYSHHFIKGELTFVVDSDDTLVPQAIETICSDWESYKNNDSIWGLVYQRGVSENSPFNERLKFNGEIGNWIDVMVNAKHAGGTCEIVRTDLFTACKFPEFDGERFVGESFLWMELSKRRNACFSNKILYLVNFQKNGLTNAGRKFRLQNPNGGYIHACLFFDKRVRFSIKLKYAILAVCYSRLLKKSFFSVVKECDCIFLIFACFIPGVLLKKFWTFKYK